MRLPYLLLYFHLPTT
ncbi:hypothetical protein E2C01_072405 [Portunus trituberculatus]|uniref:Uncharacterized protein n=1 Tax=Portunus trituberculatus TaxID=210409 RepID=A0A5B7I7M1_PORTR|nr:hypothetical protein [Portunus trituberculatus]